ncbi:MAG TPA: phosphotransferase [Myxococcota bacterium]
MTAQHNDSSNSNSTTIAMPTTPAELIERFRRAGGPAVTTTQTDFDQTGLDFVVVHAVDEAGQRWIIRAPRRRDVVDGMDNEARVLRLVARHLPFAVPGWRVCSTAVDDAVVGYVRLPGTPVLALNDGVPSFSFALDAPPVGFVNDMARVLVAMRAVGVDEARAGGVVVVDDAGRSELRRQLEQTREALGASAKLQAHWQSIVHDDDHWAMPLALSHGDLHPGHWLVNDAQRLLGVLDWTEAKFTHPATDLAMIYGCCGEAALTALLDRLGTHGVSTSTTTTLSAAAKARWSLSAVQGAAWALRTGNEAILAMVQSQLPAHDAALG